MFSTCKGSVFFLLMIASGISQAQNIVLNNTLTDDSEKLPVKMGTQWVGKIWPFKFGEYKVVKSKLGWRKTTIKGNLLNTKTESKTTEKFSFVMTNMAKDSAKVNAANNVMVRALQEVEILPHLWIGHNELVQEERNFSAYITINSDTTETWVLLMYMMKGNTTEGNFETILTNGERKIFLVPASSNKNGDDKRLLHALGYEFFEQGKSLSATQYYGGGLWGMNKNIVWLSNAQDKKMKLILAAAMAAVLQLKVTAPTQDSRL